MKPRRRARRLRRGDVPALLILILLPLLAWSTVIALVLFDQAAVLE